MALAIVWSPKSLHQFHSIISYLEQNWPAEVARDFVERTEEVLKTIANNPSSYRRLSRSSKSREAVITKQNLLIYRVTRESVTLIAFFDTRQNPRKKLS